MRVAFDGIGWLGVYLSDDVRLVQVIGVGAGLLVEDVKTGKRQTLAFEAVTGDKPYWRKIEPAEDAA